jgi:hypothetical protein
MPGCKKGPVAMRSVGQRRRFDTLGGDRQRRRFETLGSTIFYGLENENRRVLPMPGCKKVPVAIAHLFVYQQLPKSGIVLVLAPTVDYDATIEASCYCRGKHAK